MCFVYIYTFLLFVVNHLIDANHSLHCVTVENAFIKERFVDIQFNASGMIPYSRSSVLGTIIEMTS